MVTQRRPGMSGGAERALGRRRPAPTSAGSGDVADPPTRSDVRPRDGVVASLQDRTGPTGIQMLPVGEIADNPDNPRSAVGDVDELAQSIGIHGVLEPVLVAPASSYAAARPEHAEALTGYPWVLLAGHRRKAAAAAAGLTTVPAIVREDLDGPGAIAIMFAENFHREDLTPLEEAATFALLRELGLPQTQIAVQTGCSQSHVSKRLTLLTLPPAAQEALRAGQVPLNDALALAGLSPQDQGDAWQRHQDTAAGLRNTVQAIVDERVRQEAEAKLREKVQDEGLEVIDAEDVFGDSAGEHQLRSEDEVEAARAAGALLVDVTDGHRRHYRAPDLAGDDTAGTSPYEAPVAAQSHDEAPEAASPPAVPAPRQGQGEALGAETVERKRARRTRLPACAQAARARVGAGALNQALLEAVLHRLDLTDHAALELAEQWTSTATSEPTTAGDLDAQRWLGYVREDGDQAARRAAVWALIVAARELRARATHRAWDDLDARHLQDLVDLAGYTPTDWERARLDDLTHTATGGQEQP